MNTNEVLNKLIAEIDDRLHCNGAFDEVGDSAWHYDQGMIEAYKHIKKFITSLQQEQQMPDSNQLIAEWEKEKEVLEQKDFCGDAERMAYNAFLDGFVKGLGYEGTK